MEDDATWKIKDKRINSVDECKCSTETHYARLLKCNAIDNQRKWWKQENGLELG